MPTFTVLCRIDAFADYTAKVKANSATKAAELAQENHGDYKWVHGGTAEFDARTYITLDKEGREIEGTQVGDF